MHVNILLYYSNIIQILFNIFINFYSLQPRVILQVMCSSIETDGQKKVEILVPPEGSQPGDIVTFAGYPRMSHRLVSLHAAEYCSTRQPRCRAQSQEESFRDRSGLASSINILYLCLIIINSSSFCAHVCCYCC